MRTGFLILCLAVLWVAVFAPPPDQAGVLAHQVGLTPWR